MIQTFEIGYPLMSVNKWSKMHWAAQGKYKDEIMEQVFFSAKASKVKTPKAFPAVVNIVTFLHAGVRRDGDNYSGGSTVKAIMDALVHASVLPDDSTDYVKSSVEIIKIPQKDKEYTLISVIDGETVKA